MKYNWREIPLGDYAEINMGQSPKSEYYNENNEGTPFLQGSKTFGNVYPIFEKYTTKITKLADKNDILFSVRAPVGEINIAPEQLCIGRGLAALSSSNNIFLYYLLKYNQNRYEGFSSGTVFSSINKNTLNKIPVNIPDSKTQEKISNVLWSIDSKIELNNQMIDTLEEIASTLFKRWFVDFEFPDENGNPYKSSGGNMIDSELGEIPEGWEVCCISEIIEKSTNKIEIDQLSLKNYVSTENLLPNKKGLTNAAKLPNQVKVNKFEENDILISNIRPYFKKIWYSDRIGGYSNDILNFKSNKTVSSEFLYLYLKDDSFFNFMMATSKGTKMPRGDKTAIQNKELAIPCKSIDELFKAKIIYLLRKIKILNSQNTELGMLRDTLLPKLLTGEFEV